MISDRMKMIGESSTIALNQIAMDMQRKGTKIYNFGIGEPYQTTPVNIIESAFENAKNGKTHYTPSNGIPELREKISEKFKRKNNIMADPSQIVVTPTKYALFLTAMAILNPGDKVIIPEPYWVSYPYIIRLSGGIPIFIGTTEEYELEEDMLRKSIVGNVKALILNNPLNPVGKVYSEKSIRKLTDIILEYNNIYLISDETYEDIIYDGRMFSPASIPEMADRTVTISGFSKSYAMTGWRIGYMTGPKDIIDSANIIQQHTITCAASISQYAALAALNDEKTPIKLRNAFLKRMKLVTHLLSESDAISFYKPQGTFYVFPSYNFKINSDNFTKDLLVAKHVIVTPGTAFGRQGEYHFRISYATSLNTIEEGIPLIIKYLEEKTK
ncbi:MAG: pyridoxal phosphate-dependent aminotransferase [Thermoplasmatales archaeon]